MVAALGVIDALILTAGIGENSEAVRRAACENFGYLNLKLDAVKNDRFPLDEDIAENSPKVRVLVIRTQEDWVIACECWRTKNKPIRPPSSKNLIHLILHMLTS